MFRTSWSLTRSLTYPVQLAFPSAVMSLPPPVGLVYRSYPQAHREGVTSHKVLGRDRPPRKRRVKRARLSHLRRPEPGPPPERGGMIRISVPWHGISGGMPAGRGIHTEVGSLVRVGIHHIVAAYDTGHTGDIVPYMAGEPRPSI